MLNRIRLPLAALILGIVVVAGIGGQQAAALPKPAAHNLPVIVAVAGSADNADKCTQNFFELVPWYGYMGEELWPPGTPGDLSCSVRCFNIFPHEVANECGKKASDIPSILLAIIDDLLRISGLVAIGFIMVGAFQFVTSRGSPEATASARNTLINAVAGLAIAAIAVGFVSFIGSQF